MSTNAKQNENRAAKKGAWIGIELLTHTLTRTKIVSVRMKATPI